MAVSGYSMVGRLFCLLALLVYHVLGRLGKGKYYCFWHIRHNAIIYTIVVVRDRHNEEEG